MIFSEKHHVFHSFFFQDLVLIYSNITVYFSKKIISILTLKLRHQCCSCYSHHHPYRSHWDQNYSHVIYSRYLLL